MILRIYLIREPASGLISCEFPDDRANERSKLQRRDR